MLRQVSCLYFRIIGKFLLDNITFSGKISCERVNTMEVERMILKKFNGARLGLFISEAGLTHKAIADALGTMFISVTPKTIGNWINGKGEPNASELEALATILKKEKDDFYYVPPVRENTTLSSI